MSEVVEVVKDKTPEVVAGMNRGEGLIQRRLDKDEEELAELEKNRPGKPKEDDQRAPEEVEDDLPAKSKEEETWKSRYGNLRRHQQKKQDEAKAAKEKAEAELESLRKQIKDAPQLPKTEEEVAAWAKEFPDVYGVIETILGKKLIATREEQDKRFDSIKEREEAAARKMAEAELMRMHPDYKEIQEDDEFHDWVTNQPQWIQDALYNNATDAKACGRVIDLYKADTGIGRKKPGPKPNKEKEAAKDVAKPSRHQEDPQEEDYLKESDVAAMKAEEFETRLPEIEKAQASGKFIYDISGAAR
jgi:hypothetical protein